MNGYNRLNSGHFYAQGKLVAQPMVNIRFLISYLPVYSPRTPQRGKPSGYSGNRRYKDLTAGELK